MTATPEKCSIIGCSLIARLAGERSDGRRVLACTRHATSMERYGTAHSFVAYGRLDGAESSPTPHARRSRREVIDAAAARIARGDDPVLVEREALAEIYGPEVSA